MVLDLLIFDGFSLFQSFLDIADELSNVQFKMCTLHILLKYCSLFCLFTFFHYSDCELHVFRKQKRSNDTLILLTSFILEFFQVASWMSES